MSNMDMFQPPQFNRQIRNSLNVMCLAVLVAYKADSGPKLNVVIHMMIILMYGLGQSFPGTFMIYQNRNDCIDKVLVPFIAHF